MLCTAHQDACETHMDVHLEVGGLDLMEAVEPKEQCWQSPRPETPGNVAAPETGGSRSCGGTCGPGIPPLSQQWQK